MTKIEDIWFGEERNCDRKDGPNGRAEENGKFWPVDRVGRSYTGRRPEEPKDKYGCTDTNEKTCTKKNRKTFKELPSSVQNGTVRVTDRASSTSHLLHQGKGVSRRAE